MRHWLTVLSAAVILTGASPHAQNQQPPATGAITLTGGPESGLRNVPIGLGGSTGAIKPIGRTDPMGWMMYDPTLLAGKPRVDVVIIRCTNQSVPLSIHLWPAGTGASDPAPQGCTEHRKNGFFIWGDTATIDVSPVGPGAPTQQDSPFFFSNPLSWAVVGGGAAAGIIIATSGGSTNTTGTGGTGTPTGMETRSFTTVVLNTFSGTLAVTSQTGACGFTGSSASFSFSGNQTATSAIVTESSTGVTFPSVGGTTQSPTNDGFVYTGTGTGTVPGLGGYSDTTNVGFTVGGNTISGTVGLVFPACGTVNLAVTGSR